MPRNLGSWGLLPKTPRPWRSRLFGGRIRCKGCTDDEAVACTRDDDDDDVVAVGDVGDVKTCSDDKGTAADMGKGGTKEDGDGERMGTFRASDDSVSTTSTSTRPGSCSSSPIWVLAGMLGELSPMSLFDVFVGLVAANEDTAAAYLRIILSPCQRNDCSFEECEKSNNHWFWQCQ